MSPCSGSFMILFITFVTCFSLDFPDLLLDIQINEFLLLSNLYFPVLSVLHNHEPQ